MIYLKKKQELLPVPLLLARLVLIKVPVRVFLWIPHIHVALRGTTLLRSLLVLVLLVLPMGSTTCSRRPETVAVEATALTVALLQAPASSLRLADTDPNARCAVLDTDVL